MKTIWVNLYSIIVLKMHLIFLRLVTSIFLLNLLSLSFHFCFLLYFLSSIKQKLYATLVLNGLRLTYVPINFQLPSKFLLGVVTTVSRMAKNCALRLTPHKLYFILNDTAAEGGVKIWCEVNQVFYVAH